MRKFSVKTTLPVSVTKTFHLLSDVENYPKYMPYLSEVKLHGEFKEGSKWVDHHTVIFIPLKTTHTNKTVKTNKELFFDVKMPLGTILTEQILFEGNDKETKLTVNFELDLRLKILNNTIGLLMEKRLSKLVRKTNDNFISELKS